MATPKLRFKEFDNDWINTKVKDLGEFSSGGTPSKDIHDYWNGNIPWISSSDLNEESIFDIRINRFISEDAIKNSATKKIPKNSILLVSRVGVGKVALTNQELCTSQDFTALTPKKDYALFIAYLMKNITPRLLDLNQGTSIKGFVREDLISLPISLPSKAEQTKIATFLSAVDEKIAQLSQKHQLLSQYKQGMMQKLFSQKIRFKADDGSEFSEWKTLKFKYFIQERNQICSDATVELCSLTIEKGVTEKTERYTRDFLVKDEKNAYKEVHFNDFVMNPMNLRFGAIAKSNMDKIVKISKYYNVFNINQNIVNLDYFVYFSVSKPIIDFYNLMSTGSLIEKRRNHFKDFIQYEKSFPCLEEQTKIANFLSAIDQKIEVTAQQIEQAKQWKKGLLQQMFV